MGPTAGPDVLEKRNISFHCRDSNAGRTSPKGTEHVHKLTGIEAGSTQNLVVSYDPYRYST
jgi:hypothetical protein